MRAPQPLQLQRPACPPPRPGAARSDGPLPSPSPTSPTAADSPSAPANGHQGTKPVKSTSLVAAKLEVARTRDRLAQEKRRWPRALHAPPSAAAPPSDLAESPPRESTTGPAAASVAPTIAAPPPADRRPASSSRFRRARILLDLKYNGSWRGNDKRYFTGRDAEDLPYPLPHRRRAMPPGPLRHSAPNGPEHVSVDFAAGLPVR